MPGTGAPSHNAPPASARTSRRRAPSLALPFGSLRPGAGNIPYTLDARQDRGTAGIGPRGGKGGMADGRTAGRWAAEAAAVGARP